MANYYFVKWRIMELMFSFMNVAKALSDESRVRILLALRDRELCVCRVIDMLQLAPSTVSKHLFILKQARLIESRKEGRWIYYRIPSGTSSNIVKEALAWVGASLMDDDIARTDNERLMELLAENSGTRCSQ
jgi:DNA-binding transcriptional ArsR family regulator